MLETPLSPVEQRVLGCLVEKELSTPEYYPLTLNALVNACNQSTNRDPVLQLGAADVEDALESLKVRRLAWAVNAPGARVMKFEHNLSGTFGLSVQEAAILAELLLRGPQTPGELRGRCTRMYAFQDLVELDAALKALMESETTLACQQSRQPGSREIRYAHLLGPMPEPGDAAETPRTAVQTPSRVDHLEQEITALRQDLEILKEEFRTFRKQFE